MNFRLSLSGYPGIVRAHPVVGVSGVAIQAIQTIQVQVWPLWEMQEHDPPLSRLSSFVPPTLFHPLFVEPS